MNLKIWSPLGLVDEKLLLSVRLAYVFNREVILVTDDDEVLAFGPNNSGCLGIEGKPWISRPTAITALQKKQIKGITFGGTLEKPFVVAHTLTGTVYFWGEQLGIRNSLILKPTLIDQLTEKITKVACGIEHCLVLSVDGKVFGWGNNGLGQLGIGSFESAADPVAVRGIPRGERVVKISCGLYFSVAVLENGHVYAWGSNFYNQLGQIDATVYFPSPIRVFALDNVVIKKIICGPTHVLAVSDTCALYVWGRNEHAELAFPSSHKSIVIPVENKRIGRVTKVAASIFHYTSAALSVNNEVIYWGESGSGYWSSGRNISNFKSLNEVFAHYGFERIMYKPVRKQLKMESVRETIKNVFDQKESSDLTIIAEGREIFVHRTILRLRSEYFRTLLQEHWLDKNERSITINQSYDALHAYLRYLYTDELEVDTNVAVEVLYLVHEYGDTVVKELSENTIKRGITIENVTSLYDTALELDAAKLLKSCQLYAASHMSVTMDIPDFLK